MDGVLFVESEPVRNDGVDARREGRVPVPSPAAAEAADDARPERTSPRLWRAVNRRSPSASKRAISPKKKRIGRLNRFYDLVLRLDLADALLPVDLPHLEKVGFVGEGLLETDTLELTPGPSRHCAQTPLLTTSRWRGGGRDSD